MNQRVQRENENAFPKNGPIAFETLCQKMKVNVIKKQGTPEKVGNLRPRQFSKRDAEEYLKYVLLWRYSNLSGYNPVQPAPGEPALAGGMD